MTAVPSLPRSRPEPGAPWPVLVVDRLDRDTVRALLDNRIAAVRRRRVLDERECAASLAALAAADAWDAYATDGPVTGKLGISQYAYGGRRAAYLADAARARARRAALVAPLADPLARLLDELRAVWPAPVGIAREDEGEYFAGVFRSGAGIRLHADWGPRDGAGWSIADVVAQLAWNLYYAVPATGGELLVYDRPWAPELEQHARQELYDYDPVVVRGRDRVRITFDAGDLVLFSSSNVHSVADSPSGATRVTASSFVGERPDGSLVLWS